MPRTIPYDPSLVLGNLVSLSALRQIEELDQYQALIDAANEELQSYITMKRSLTLTKDELAALLKAPPFALVAKLKEVDAKIVKSAENYVKVYLANSKTILAKKMSITNVHANYESPIDYNRSVLNTSMPLSSDSLKLHCQYFSFDANVQTSAAFASTVSGFVANSLSIFGNTVSKKTASSAQSQVSRQAEMHNISGTLVIAATCTHKNAVLFEPLVLDVDKAVRVWNKMYPSKKINITDPTNVLSIANEVEGSPSGGRSSDGLVLLSGATYGSSFVGMVHIVRSTSTFSSQKMSSVASHFDMNVAAWFGRLKGGIGMDSSFASSMKSLLSTQNVTSHINVITMGSIPSIKSNEIKIAVKQYANFDPAKTMEQLTSVQNASKEGVKTLHSAATEAQNGGTMVAMEGAKIANIMSGISEVDDGKNKVLDVNSLMTAFDDYVDKALKGNIGVPINYYLKTITRSELANMWIQQYFPDAETSPTTTSNTANP